MKIYLIEQNIRHIKGEYLTEAVVIAEGGGDIMTRIKAASDALGEAWDIYVDHTLLTVSLLADMKNPSAVGSVLFLSGGVQFISVGTGEDND